MPSNRLPMNLPNALTLSRIAFLFVVVGLLLTPASWTGAATGAFVLFIVASVTDWLDGYIARRYGIVSNFGKLMDALADKILIVGMFVVLLAADILPSWSVLLVLIILSREFLITGLRLLAASKGRVLAAERAGKLKTVMQIICISIYLLHELLVRDASLYGLSGELSQRLALGSATAGMALLVVATLMTAYSGVGYLIRYADVLCEEEQA